TLRKIGKWIKKNPDKAVAIAGAIGKRQTPSEDAVMEALVVACGDFPPDATPTDAVTQAFMEADVNEDGKLSEEEAAEFAKMLGLMDIKDNYHKNSELWVPKTRFGCDSEVTRRAVRGPQDAQLDVRQTTSHDAQLDVRQTTSHDAQLDVRQTTSHDAQLDVRQTTSHDAQLDVRQTTETGQCAVDGNGDPSDEEQVEFANMLGKTRRCSCTIINNNYGKRDGKPDSAKPDGDVLIGALSQACPDLDFAPDTQVSQLVQDAFQDVDANKDGQLNANEVAEFATMI
ncbi:hypothetical protein BaRGS_00031485, partial [Batillaria attramentaria]